MSTAPKRYRPGNVLKNEKGGAAADHWNRVAEDTALLRDVGANAYRFSIEWSRVEPALGQWDDAAWAHYVDEEGIPVQGYIH